MWMIYMTAVITAIYIYIYIHENLEDGNWRRGSVLRTYNQSPTPCLFFSISLYTKFKIAKLCRYCHNMTLYNITKFQIHILNI